MSKTKNYIEEFLTQEEMVDIQKHMEAHLVNISESFKINLIYGIEVTPKELKMHKTKLGRMLMDEYIVDCLNNYYEDKNGI